MPCKIYISALKEKKKKSHILSSVVGTKRKGEELSPSQPAKKRGRPAADGIAVDHCWICEEPHQRRQHAKHYRKSLALWKACGRPMQDVSGVERPDMTAARAIQTRKASQKCRKCGKNHFPFCKPSGKRPPRGGERRCPDPNLPALPPS